jgi:tetratricopeptide (TPR) repeat protein
LHYGELANAYAALGMGNAARRAARRGVELEPKRSDAYVILGAILRLDTLGREHGDDADRVGAIAALRKGLELDPKHQGGLATLAELLIADPRGAMTSNTRDLDEAIALMRRHDDNEKTHDHDAQIAVALMHEGKWSEAEALARTLPDSTDRSRILIAAIAGGRGPSAAHAEASSVVRESDHDKVMASAATTLMFARRYDAMRALFAEVHDPTGGNALFARIIAHIKPLDLATLDPTDPKSTLVLLTTAVVSGPPHDPPWSPELWTQLRADAGKSAMPWKSMRTIPIPVLEDMVAAVLDPRVDGNARDGWRLSQDDGTSTTHTFFVLDHGRAKLIGDDTHELEVGKLMLGLLGKGDGAAAARWFGWLAEVPGSPIAGLYQQEQARVGTATPSKDAIELAAAFAVKIGAPKLAIPILQRCTAPDVIHKDCRRALAVALATADRYPEAAEVVRTDLDLSPARQVSEHARMLMYAGKRDEAVAEVEAALAKMPDDRLLLVARARLGTLGDWAAAQPWLDRLVDAPTATQSDFNLVAWSRLYFDATPDRAHEVASRGELRDKTIGSAFANTIAAIEAESDRPFSAWSYELKALADHDDAPDSGDWYVVGRIAESYGLRDDAIAAYKRVTPAPPKDLPPTPYLFAHRRLAALGVH